MALFELPQTTSDNYYTFQDDNLTLRTWDPKGELEEPPVREGILAHHEVLLRLDAMDLERGAKVAGHRGYYLTNEGVDLNQALIAYALDFLRKRGYKKIMPPFFMNKDQMAKTAQLDQFDEELYKVNGFLKVRTCWTLMN
jgi:seryl-tRNA synthetase